MNLLHVHLLYVRFPLTKLNPDAEDVSPISLESRKAFSLKDGQPRQEDLLSYLSDHTNNEASESLSSAYRICLAPR
jgi:hypothetical protein